MDRQTSIFVRALGNSAGHSRLPERDAYSVAGLSLTRSGLHIPAVDVESQRAWDDEGAVTLPVGLDVSQDVDAE